MNSKTTCIIAILLLILISPSVLCASSWYVDSAATGANNGTSWINAWTTLPTSGLSDGDIVYISGGATGNTKTYNRTGSWTPQGGTSTAITYKIGQTASHNGTAIFNRTAGDNWFINAGDNMVISGDAGDGQQHFKVTGFTVIATDTDGPVNNVRLSYFYGDNLNKAFHLTEASGAEIDHNWLRISDAEASAAVYIQGAAGGTWDSNRIHHNMIYLVYDPSNSYYGPDGFQAVKTGISIYNNTIIGFPGTYTGGQHMDGWQLGTTIGTYFKIYNNTIVDMTNYGLYAEGTGGTIDIEHLWIYNNLIYYTNTGIVSLGNPIGIVVSSKNSGTVNDVIIANNTIVDSYGTGGTEGIAVANSGGATLTGTYIRNNALVNCKFPLETVSGWTVDHNAIIGEANAQNTFTNYTVYAATANNMGLKSGDTVCKNQGYALSPYFTTDINGSVRGAAWDIGAYEYIGNHTLGSGPQFSIGSGATVTIQ